MTNNYLSVLYKHIIQEENKNVGLKVGLGGGGTNIPLPRSKRWGGGGSVYRYRYRNILKSMLKKKYLKLGNAPLRSQ